MREVVVVVAAVLGAGCGGKVHLPVFEVSAALKAKARVEISAGVEAPPAEPPTPVPLEGAEVVEFFGISLEGAQDVVFVLDRSGSMADLAQGRIAEIVIRDDEAAPAPYVDDVDDVDAPDVTEPEPQPESQPPEFDPAQPGLAPPPPPPPPRKIDVARSELLAALAQLPSGTRMNVVFFNDGLEAFAPAVGVLDDASRPRIASFIRDTDPRGSTALATAMRLAFVMKARRVVLLSDGLGNIGGRASDVLRDAREAMLGGVRIDTIGLGADQDAALLDALARESGGLYQAL